VLPGQFADLPGRQQQPGLPGDVAEKDHARPRQTEGR
jgi:hypothetical protein